MYNLCVQPSMWICVCACVNIALCGIMAVIDQKKKDQDPHGPPTIFKVYPAA